MAKMENLKLLFLVRIFAWIGV